MAHKNITERRRELFEQGKLPDPPKGHRYNDAFKIIPIQNKKPYGNIKKGLSPYQIKTNEEFLKVREGESLEQWRKRTMRRRLLTTEDLKVTKKGKKKLRQRMVRQKRYDDKFVTIQKAIPFNDFLKYYVPVMTYASIKYNMHREDLELCFYFYSSEAFTKAEFNNKCKAFGLSSSVMSRFYNEGYISRVDRTKKVKSFYKISNDHHFRLSRQVMSRIKFIYKYLAQERAFAEKRGGLRFAEKDLDKELYDWLVEMNNEAKDIIAGRKLPDTIIDKNESDIES